MTILARKIFTALALMMLTATAAFAGSGHVWTVKNKVPDEYIVVLADQATTLVDDVVQSLVTKHGGTLLGTLKVGVKGYGVRMTAAQAATLSANPLVQHVEENGYASVSSYKTFLNDSYWHLDRIDTHNVYPTALDPISIFQPALASTFTCSTPVFSQATPSSAAEC